MSSLVLIVDDDVIAREGLEAILEMEDYQLIMASNGREAIEKALAFSPDVILLDVMMPEMDGFEVCRRIRAIPEISEVPIVILTALDDRESFLHGLEAGADDFLTKPYNRFELRARVGTITRLNRYRRLMHERARTRELTKQLINIQEEERRKISQELHDEFGQALTTLGIGLKILYDDLPVDLQAPRNQISDMLNLTRKTFDLLHLMGNDLRPPALDTLGLIPTLEGYCRDFSRRTQLPIRFSTEGEIPSLSDLYNITFYRFLQEGLANVAKHAAASQVWVKFSVQPGGVRLSVQDDGKGFNQVLSGEVATIITREDGSNGMGIMGMEERLALLGGHLEINSQPGQGTRITGWLPAPTQVSND